MYLEQQRVLFIHIPKTAGNFIQKHLLPFSADELRVSSHQDGKDRFDVIGAYTPHKHATLDEYQARMPADLFQRLSVMTAVRHPVERMLSLYFSPHAWMTLPLPKRVIGKISSAFGVKKRYGAEEYKKKKPVYRKAAFEDLVARTASISDYLSVNGQVRQPEDIIRHEHLEDDFRAFCRKYDLPEPDEWGKVNASSASDLLKELRSDSAVAAIVKRHHGKDFEQFGYD